MRRIVLLALLFLLLGVIGGSSDSVLGFRFRARLLSASKHSESARLRRGYFLKPIHPVYRTATYQNVILCRDLDLKFDERGLSQEVEILGFCSGPGQAIPVKEVEWWIPGFVDKTIRDYGCNRNTIEKVRREQMTPGPAMTENEPVDTCKGDENSCIAEFDAYLTLNYGISYRDADEAGICDRVPSRDNKEVIYKLFCDQARLEAAKRIAS